MNTALKCSQPAPRSRIKHSLTLATFLAALAITTMPIFAQSGETGEGKQAGGYKVHQSVEFGGHITDFSGSASLWNTFVNLDSGPRLLSQTLEMRSDTHSGTLFDELWASSFGYGGDPNNATRLRISKGRWYNFTGSFRRDRNFWDYSLLANPLNPANSNPNVPIFISPHRFETVRRMQDYALTLMPLSPVRVRLGYSRNVSEGPSFSTYHGGTETLLRQNWRNGLDSYQAGFDFKVLPRTNLSYDQFIHKFKGDTNWNDQFFFNQLPNGTPVDLGLVFNTLAGQPCAPPLFVAGGAVKPTCNGETAYNRSNPTRTSYPVEQFSFQSNYFKRVDLSGRMIYSSGSSDVDFSQEFFQGLITRTNQSQFLATGPSTARRISVTSDFGLTAHLTDKFRFTESFRWNTFRLPGLNTQNTSSLFSTSMVIPANVFNPATCPSNAATCPQHNTSSSADLITAQYVRFLGENSKINTVELEYDFTRRIGGNLGYRYQNRDIVHRNLDTLAEVFFPNMPNRGDCVGKVLAPNGTCTTTVLTPSTGLATDETKINEHSLLFGVWLKPSDAFRVNFDSEFLYADNSFTRISLRHLQQYRLRTNYEPRKWINVGMAINIRENRNNIPEIANLQHNRSYSFTAVAMPNDKWSFDASYNYNDVHSQTNICYVSTPAPAGVLKCSVTPFLQRLSFYDSTSHFGAANVMFKPALRLTTSLGYTVTHNNGNTLILNPNTPLGTLDFNYYLPTATVAFDFSKEWTWKAGWNYYDYGEQAPAGPAAPRNFHGNVVTLALRYAF